MQSTTVLVVEDDPSILEFVSEYLRSDGYAVFTAFDGLSALEQARTVQPDIIVLDVGLPGIDGIEVCRRIQQEMDVYVLMLTARSDEIDKVVGLAVGADDYLTKPFSPRELLVRVKAVLRRGRAVGGPQPPPPKHEARPALAFGDLEINPEARTVRRGSTSVVLTPREFELLYTLAAHPGQVFSRDQLLSHVWGQDYAGIDRVVDVHIGLLRRKIELDPANPMLVQTVRGMGYRFVVR